MRQAGQAAQTGEIISTFKILFRRSEEKKPFWRLMCKGMTLKWNFKRNRA
jgi:hypothetical protein